MANSRPGTSHQVSPTVTAAVSAKKSNIAFQSATGLLSSVRLSEKPGVMAVSTIAMTKRAAKALGALRADTVPVATSSAMTTGARK